MRLDTANVSVLPSRPRSSRSVLNCPSTSTQESTSPSNRGERTRPFCTAAVVPLPWWRLSVILTLHYEP